VRFAKLFARFAADAIAYAGDRGQVAS
jgi:hypothetical protein